MPHRWRGKSASAAVLLTAITLAACGGGSEGTPIVAGNDASQSVPPQDTGATTAPTSAEPDAADTAPAEENPASELLAFTAESLTGSSVAVGDFVGDDLVIWFWEPH